MDKLSDLLPDEIKPKIVNPQGILLLGRSKEFNEQQKGDFEIIKRQYKNITDIMTYDDLAQRLRNVVSSLKQRIQKMEKKLRQEMKYLEYIDYAVSFRRAMELQINSFILAIEKEDASYYHPIWIR